MHEDVTMTPKADITLQKFLCADRAARRERKSLAFSPFSLSREFSKRLRGERGLFWRHASCGLVALLLTTFDVTASGAAEALLRPMKNPVPASAFMLRDMDGKLVSLRDFEGKVVLLNFWATWCTPCRKEMPAMEQLYRTYGTEGLVVVGVSVDRGAPGDVKAFAEKLKITFPILHDRDSIISQLYSNPGVPSSYLIDRQGRIVYRVLGEYDWFSPEARDAVKGLLQKSRKNNEG